MSNKSWFIKSKIPKVQQDYKSQLKDDGANDFRDSCVIPRVYWLFFPRHVTSCSTISVLETKTFSRRPHIENGAKKNSHSADKNKHRIETNLRYETQLIHWGENKYVNLYPINLIDLWEVYERVFELEKWVFDFDNLEFHWRAMWDASFKLKWRDWMSFKYSVCSVVSQTVQFWLALPWLVSTFSAIALLCAN